MANKPRDTAVIAARIDHMSRKKLAFLCDIDETNVSLFVASAVGEAISRRLTELGRHDVTNYATHCPDEPARTAA